MPVDAKNLARIIKLAWNEALLEKGAGLSNAKRNAKRAETWVNSLANQFKANYRDSTYRVFWKGNEENKLEFNKNEFLFDILVCSVDCVSALPPRKERLAFIAQCHWQVESEFNKKNTRELVIDMSKLVIGSASNKLFIASHRDKRTEKQILCRWSEIAAHCDGNFYFCFVGHPEDWGREPREPVLYAYEAEAGSWQGMNSS